MARTPAGTIRLTNNGVSCPTPLPRVRRASSVVGFLVLAVFLDATCRASVHAGSVQSSISTLAGEAAQSNKGDDRRPPYSDDGQEMRLMEKRDVSAASSSSSVAAGPRPVESTDRMVNQQQLVLGDDGAAGRLPLSSMSAEAESVSDSDGPVDDDDDDVDPRDKKNFGMGASGFHGDTFSNGFGSFSTMKRGPFGGGARGFHGDAFSGGFGEFSTMRRRKKFGSGPTDGAFHGRSAFSGGFGDFSTMRKRFTGPAGFHGDTFSQGFGGFSTMKRATPGTDGDGGPSEYRRQQQQQQQQLRFIDGLRQLLRSHELDEGYPVVSGRAMGQARASSGSSSGSGVGSSGLALLLDRLEKSAAAASRRDQQQQQQQMTRADY